MRDFVLFVLSIAVIINVLFKNRKILKELTKLQMVGVGMTYLIAIFTAFLFIYFGGNWMAEQISNPLFKYIVFLIIVLVVVYPFVSNLNKVTKNITNGILPKDTEGR